jgi:ankyrin repeat protein
MASFFPNPYVSNSFARLHELVLGLKHGDLDAESKRENFEIDEQDEDGSTALEWPCVRGDGKIVKWLLDRGANPNLPNRNNGRTPLMAACTSVSLPCIELLLDHNADVNAENHWGLDALIYLCNEDRDPQPISDIIQTAKLLISRGAKVVPRGVNKVWCLAQAGRTELVEVMELILDQGVNINRRNKAGKTALSKCMGWSAARSVRLLLSRGACYTGEFQSDTDGRTLLHVAALNASIDMANVLLDARLMGLDPDIRDIEGYTAEDYINQAEGRPEGFVSTFRRLLSDIRDRYQSHAKPDAGSRTQIELDGEGWEGETYYDACEY